MSQETFERVLNAIYAGLPADIEKADPQRYQDMINLIEGCVIAALVDRLYYPNPGRLISECRTGFGPWINVPGAAIASADLSFLKNPIRSKAAIRGAFDMAVLWLLHIHYLHHSGKLSR
jgi:hypothetical protein